MFGEAKGKKAKILSSSKEYDFKRKILQNKRKSG